MLVELRIRRLALLDEVDVVFDGGLNVVSGETGEGKSLLLSAVLLLLGERADKSVVRAGATEASIEGRFAPSPPALAAVRALTDLVDEGESEICLRRVVQADGRSRAYVNGGMCPIGVLREIGARLVDLHGRRDEQSLLKQDDQREALDAFAGVESEVAEFARIHARRAETARAAAELRAEADRRAKRMAELDEQCTELLRAKLTRGEAAELLDARRLIARSAELERALDDVVLQLNEGSDSSAARAGKLAKRLAEFAALDPRVAELSERLAALQSEASDLSRTAGRIRNGLDGGSSRLSRIDDRLGELHDLERRYRARGDLLVDRFEELQAELDALAAAPSPEALEAECSELEADLHRRGLALHASRKKAGATLADEIVASLRELRLPNAVFVVEPGPPEAPREFDADLLTSTGYGRPRFMASMNVGEKAQPLEDVASGGESARVLLALKGALAGRHKIPLLVFDEIDAGVGARVGAVFGRRLAKLAEHHQVLVVTHLAQTAAFARRHLLVKKRVEGGRTSTTVRALEGAARLRELAEMLGGAEASTHAEAQARDLLAEAGG